MPPAVKSTKTNTPDAPKPPKPPKVDAATKKAQRQRLSVQKQIDKLLLRIKALQERQEESKSEAEAEPLSPEPFAATREPTHAAPPRPA
jgi:hypothetical protein